MISHRCWTYIPEVSIWRCATDFDRRETTVNFTGLSVGVGAVLYT